MICRMCKKDLGKEEFSFKNKKTDVLQTHCKSCQRDYSNQWYKENKKEHIKYVSQSKLLFKEEIKEMKNKPCADCKKMYPYYVMDFDHLPEKGKKEFIIGSNSMRRRGRLIVLKEIEKCEVVCSNCHRQRTFDRGQSYSAN